MEFGHISPSPGHIPALIIVTMVTWYQFNDFFPKQNPPETAVFVILQALTSLFMHESQTKKMHL